MVIRAIDKDVDIEHWITRILNESESLAFAGLLFDVGKRAPHLFRRVLKPFFFTWELWNWDFQLSTLRQSSTQLMGYWSHQSQQMIAAARKWYQMPHRREYLLTQDAAIPKEMLDHPELYPGAVGILVGIESGDLQRDEIT